MQGNILIACKFLSCISLKDVNRNIDKKYSTFPKAVLTYQTLLIAIYSASLYLNFML